MRSRCAPRVRHVAASLALVAASLPPTTTRAQSGAPSTAPLAPGARVRVTWREPVRVPGDPNPQLRPRLTEGRVVTSDTGWLIVQVGERGATSLPASAITRVERRLGPGACHRRPDAHFGCVFAGVVTGFALGTALSVVAVRALHDSTDHGVMNDQRHRWRTRSQTAGTLLGLTLGITWGQDRWGVVPDWPGDRR